MSNTKLLKMLIDTLNNYDAFTDHGDPTIKADLKKQLQDNPGALIDQLADIINDLVDMDDNDERRHVLEIANKYSKLPVIEYQLNIINELI